MLVVLLVLLLQALRILEEAQPDRLRSGVPEALAFLEFVVGTGRSAYFDNVGEYYGLYKRLLRLSY